MPNNQLVSVVIPFFNAEKTLERSVRSIMNQTYSNLEIILVNNNSTDNSLSIVQKLQVEDQRIQILIEKKQGVSHAANKGNTAAIGEFVARMDADDYSYSERIAKQVNFLNSNLSIGVTSCLVNHVGHTPNTQGLNKFVQWANKQKTQTEIFMNQFIEAPIINPTVLYRKELLQQHGGYLHGDFPEDYEMWLRWLNNGVQFQKVPEVLFDWYDSDTRLTRTDVRYSVDAFYKTKTKYLATWLHQNNKPYIWVWGAGRTSRKRAELIQHEGIWIEGYIDVKTRELGETCCVHFEEFNWDASSFVVSYVGNWGARKKIRNFLLSKGKIEGEDFILAS